MPKFSPLSSVNKKLTYWRERRRKQKLELFEYKGGKCERCGYNKPIMAAYAFHHLDPSKKEYEISSNTRSFAKAKKEVDKCILLCVRCHAEVHAEQNT